MVLTAPTLKLNDKRKVVTDEAKLKQKKTYVNLSGNILASLTLAA